MPSKVLKLQHHLQVKELGCFAMIEHVGLARKALLYMFPGHGWLAKGPILREAIGYGCFAEPGDCMCSKLLTC